MSNLFLSTGKNFKMTPKLIKENFKKNNLEIVLEDKGLEAINKLKNDLVLNILGGTVKVRQGLINLRVKSILNSISNEVPYLDNSFIKFTETNNTKKYIYNFICDKSTSRLIKNLMSQNGTDIVNFQNIC